MLHITGIVRQNKGRSTLSETLGQVDSVDRGNALVGPDLILRSAQPDFVPQDNYMGEDLRSQLENLYPELVTAVRPRAAKHRPYCVATIQESYARFCEEISGKDYTDQRGQTVSILEENFPKLLNLKLISTGERAKARKVLTSLRAGTFDASLYSYERDRLATLFWVPEVICDSDAIHRNGHSAIQGEEVYVKLYDKEGAPIKLVFVAQTYAGRRVITTSFLTMPDRLCKFLRFPPVWKKE